VKISQKMFLPVTSDHGARSPQELVERSTNLRQDIALLYFERGFRDFNVVIRQPRPELMLASASSLAEHEHVLGLVQVPGFGKRRSPAPIHE